MTNFDRKSFAGKAIVFLIILNLATLAVLWSFVFRRPPGRPPRPNDGGPGDVPSFLKSELRLTDEQSKSFDVLRERLGDSVRPVQDEIRRLMEAAVEEIFKPQVGEKALEDLAARIGAERAKEVGQLFLHLRGLMAVCRPEQVVKLHSIMTEFLIRIGAVNPDPPKGERVPSQGRPGGRPERDR